jgi:hypothetical protein
MEENKLNYIDDWKNEEKIERIKELIKLGKIDKKGLMEMIGNKSKKTYRNGEIIDDKTMALKKFFDISYREESENFRKKVDEYKKETMEEGKEREYVDNYIYEIIKLIQAIKICSKYDEEEYKRYKRKIEDIINTRNKEEEIFKLFNEVRYDRLVNEENHEAIKYLLKNGWKETKERYLWLTELITFVNNGSEECKNYLISKYNLKPIIGSDINAKKLMIKLVAKNEKLNKITEIIDYVFSIGNYYKHGTYYKWYSKEMEYIEIYEKYDKGMKSVMTIIENLEISIENKKKLIVLMEEYEKIINKHF